MYDVIIIWAWSAWLPAWMYASRYKLSNLIIGEMPGWALSTSHCVENYPGTLSAPGAEIMENFRKHAEAAGSTILQDRVESVSKDGEIFLVKTLWNKEFKAKKILLATGNTHKKLWIPGEDTFHWQWISYCATCDGNFYKNLIVGIVWAGNTAITEALYLSEITKEVHIFVRWEHIKAENIWTEKAKNKENIIFHMNTEVEEVIGDPIMWVKSVRLNNGEILPLSGFFVAIGSTPITHIVDNLNPQKDEDWCLIVDKRQETTIKGLYAAGDVTTNSNKFQQTIMSAAEWCLAANSIHEDLMKE